MQEQQLGGGNLLYLWCCSSCCHGACNGVKWLANQRLWQVTSSITTTTFEVGSGKQYWSSISIELVTVTANSRIKTMINQQSAASNSDNGSSRRLYQHLAKATNRWQLVGNFKVSANWWRLQSAICTGGGWQYQHNAQGLITTVTAKTKENKQLPLIATVIASKLQ